MQIIPVIDLQNGIVVRGVAGHRDSYRRIRSSLTDSCDASVILNLFKADFGFQRCYIADLDAIQHERLNRCTIAELTKMDVPLLVDRGVRRAADVEELLDLGVAEVVVALETLPDVETAASLLQNFGSERLVLSLDLMNGCVLAESDSFAAQPADQVAGELVSVGFEKLIVLDLSAVGMAGGTPTLELCRQLRDQFPGVEIITGGGVRSVADLTPIKTAGVNAALVASALHDGRLTPGAIHSSCAK